jgi:hypothetical protein
MLINLARRTTGAEILAAFKESGFQDSLDERWEANEVVRAFQCEPGSVKPIPGTVMVTIRQQVFRRTFYFFGKKCWCGGSGPKFTVVAQVDTRYESINLQIHYEYDEDQEGHASICRGPEDPGFEEIRPTFERVMANFNLALEAQSV